MTRPRACPPPDYFLCLACGMTWLAHDDPGRDEPTCVCRPTSAEPDRLGEDGGGWELHQPRYDGGI